MTQTTNVDAGCPRNIICPPPPPVVVIPNIRSVSSYWSLTDFSLNQIYFLGPRILLRPPQLRWITSDRDRNSKMPSSRKGSSLRRRRQHLPSRDSSRPTDSPVSKACRPWQRWRHLSSSPQLLNLTRIREGSLCPSFLSRAPRLPTPAPWLRQDALKMPSSGLSMEHATILIILSGVSPTFSSDVFCPLSTRTVLAPPGSLTSRPRGLCTPPPSAQRRRRTRSTRWCWCSGARWKLLLVNFVCTRVLIGWYFLVCGPWHHPHPCGQG